MMHIPSSGGTNMIVTTTENVPGDRVVDVKGQVFGVVVRSRGLAGNVMAGLRSIVGEEITEYTQLLEETRKHAKGWVERCETQQSPKGRGNPCSVDCETQRLYRSIFKMESNGCGHVGFHSSTRPHFRHLYQSLVKTDMMVAQKKD
jgi:Putative heavy-metal-binding